MKEKPILFSTPMVQAILKGCKTQTRRVVKQEANFQLFFNFNGLYVPIEHMPRYCPYGRVGDRLWVRESWGQAINIAEGDRGTLYYKATNETNWQGKWRPSIFMPRWASRITLEITDIKVQRLQEITEEDVKAEGLYDGSPLFNAYEPEYDLYLKDAYRRLWDSINGKKYPWCDNPFVWCISFKRV